MSKIIVVGGGAAGMMAAIRAAEFLKENNKYNKGDVLLLEHNEKLGKKVFITGKGRCNVTNACDVNDLFSNIFRNAKFLYSAIYGFDNYQTMSFFEATGLSLKTERGERVFPESDHSSDVIKALEKKLRELNVEICLNSKVEDICVSDNVITGVVLKNKKKISCSCVILATGGVSYPVTGSTGDGIKWAENTGHKITKLMPGLVPFVCKEEYVKQLQGLSLKNVRLSINDGKKQLYSDEGEMLFTHFGISGPLVLSASSAVSDNIGNNTLEAFIDLKMALSPEQLDKRILRDFEKNINKNFANAVTELLPSKLIPVVISLSEIDPYKKVHEITKEERQQFIKILKSFPITIVGLRGFNEAIITRGGVGVKNINPSTMESKLISGLYFAGEMIDVDAKTGGFNLQIAWSTGHLAGESAAEKIISE